MAQSLFQGTLEVIAKTYSSHKDSVARADFQTDVLISYSTESD
jgi:hypothetical protein